MTWKSGRTLEKKRWKSNTTYHIDHTVQILIIAAIFSPPPSHVTNRLNNRIEVRAVFDTKEKKEEVLPRLNNRLKETFIIDDCWARRHSLGRYLEAHRLVEIEFEKKAKRSFVSDLIAFHKTSNISIDEKAHKSAFMREKGEFKKREKLKTLKMRKKRLNYKNRILEVV